jgi:rubrerythrin
MNFKSVDEVLDFAIAREQESHDFYTDLSKNAATAGMKQVFADFAQEELGHKKKIQAVKDGKTLLSAEKRISDLKISDYTVDVKPGANVNYQEALIIAMKKEKAAFKLYSDLAATAGNSSEKQLFLGLAQEEAKHKLRFEIEYDSQIMNEN